MNETVKLKIGGEEFDCPPLKFGAIKQGAFKVIKRLNAIKESIDPQDKSNILNPMSDYFEEIGACMVEVFQMALVRKYPHVTKEWMEDSISLGDVITLVNTFPLLMEISGFVMGESVTESMGGKEPLTEGSPIGGGLPPT